MKILSFEDFSILEKSKFKKGDLINTPFGSYYIDGLPNDLDTKIKSLKSLGVGAQEYELCKLKVNIFNGKYVNSDRDYVAETRSWFDGKQPSKAKVNRALIWSYDQEHDYQIKAGGESASDSIYVSSFTITISDDNHDDKDVVLIKKYSTDFEDVLITIDEIQYLQDLVETPETKSKRKADDLYGYIKYILSEYGNKSFPNDNFFKKMKVKYTLDETLKCFDYLTDKRLEDYDRSYLGDTEEKVAIRKKQKEEHIKKTERLRQLIIDKFEND